MPSCKQITERVYIIYYIAWYNIFEIQVIFVHVHIEVDLIGQAIIEQKKILRKE